MRWKVMFSTVLCWAALVAFSTWAFVALRPLFSPSPVVPRAVVRLIAGISLVDSLLIAGGGAPMVALVGPAGLLATLALQRWVSGT